VHELVVVEQLSAVKVLPFVVPQACPHLPQLLADSGVSQPSVSGGVVELQS
jgi:hypothetical protein